MKLQPATGGREMNDLENATISDLLRALPHADVKRVSVQFAIFCAEQCLDVFERQCPSDSRPRAAIEAAKACSTNTANRKCKWLPWVAWASWTAAEAAIDGGASALKASRAVDAAAQAAAKAAAWAAQAAAEATEDGGALWIVRVAAEAAREAGFEVEQQRAYLLEAHSG